MGITGVVVHGRRRTCGPLQRPRVPRIVPGGLTSQVRPHQIGGENQDPSSLKGDADGDDQIPDVPAAARLIRIDPARHSQNARNVHEVERQMKANKKQPEVQLAERFVIHLAGHFGEPVVERSEDAKENAAHDDVVKVRHHVVRVTELPIERSDGERYSSQSGNKKLEQKSDAEQHRRCVPDLATPHGREPIEDFDARRDSNRHRGEDEERIRACAHAYSEHVMRPHAHADEPDRHGRQHHHRVAENRLARKDGNDFRREREGGQHKNIDLRMPEDPEEVHPDDGRAAGLGVEEMPSEVAVDHEHDLRCGKRADC